MAYLIKRNGCILRLKHCSKLSHIFWLVMKRPTKKLYLDLGEWIVLTVQTFHRKWNECILEKRKEKKRSNEPLVHGCILIIKKNMLVGDTVTCIVCLVFWCSGCKTATGLWRKKKKVHRLVNWWSLLWRLSGWPSGLRRQTQGGLPSREARDRAFWSPNGGVGSNPTPDKIHIFLWKLIKIGGDLFS